MSFKSTYILFGVLVVMLAIFNIAIWLAPLKERDETYVFPSAHEEATKVTSEDITRVTVQLKKPSKAVLVFSRDKDKKWQMEKPADFRLDETAVNTLVDEVLTLRRQDTEISDNLARWELEDPKLTAVVKLEGKGQTFELKVGKRAGTQAYILASSYPLEPFVVQDSNIKSVFQNVNAYRARDLLAETLGEIEHVEVRKGGEKPVILTSDKGKWSFVQPPYGAADYEGGSGDDPDAPTGVRDLLSALTNLRVIENGFIKDDASTKDLKEHGLESEDKAAYALTVKHDPKKNEVRTLLIGNKVKDKDDYFARLAASSYIVQVPGKSLETIQGFLKNPQQVRDHSLFRLAKDPDVVRVKYFPSGKVMELVKTKTATGLTEWKMYQGSDKTPKPTDDKEVKALIEEMQNKRVVRAFPKPGSKEAELGDKVVEVSLWVDGIEEKKEEKKEDKKDGKKEEKKDEKKEEKDTKPTIKEKPDVVLVFGRDDAEKGTTVVEKKIGDETTIVTVPNNLRSRVAQQPLTYFTRTLPPFTDDPTFKDVTGVTIERDGKVTEVELKDKDKEKVWVIQKPSTLEGRKADEGSVRGVLNTFFRMRVEQWIDTDATDDALKKYGLDKPSMRVAISMKDPKKSVEFLIGKETKGSKNHYALQKGNRTVFEVSAFVLEDVRRPLQDMTVFDFNHSDVQTVKVTGWQEVVGTPVVRKLERESGATWTMAEPKGLSPNNEKVERLLVAISSLQAEEFVVIKGGPKPEHGLDVKKGALEIEITFKDKTTKKLLLGGNAKEATYYASSDQLPGDVFTVQKGPFEELRKKPVYLTDK